MAYTLDEKKFHKTSSYIIVGFVSFMVGAIMSKSLEANRNFDSKNISSCCKRVDLKQMVDNHKEMTSSNNVLFPNISDSLINKIGLK